MLFSLLLALAAHASAPSWIEASNKIALEYAREDGTLFPERASSVGLKEFDAQGLRMQRNQNELEGEFIQRWIRRLGEEEKKAKDANLRIDLKILRQNLLLRQEQIRLEEKHRMVFFQPASRFVLESLLSLINEQSSAEQKAAAVARFQKYVRGAGEEPPLLTAFRNRTISELIRFRKKALTPLKIELEEYLAQSKAYVAGVEQALTSSGVGGWKEDFALFRLQSAAYDEFVKADLLPVARAEFRLPKDLYALTLRQRGVFASPETLIRQAKAEYKQGLRELERLAAEVAKKHSLQDPKPVAVIAYLKRQQVLAPEEVKKLFEAASQKLEQIIREKNLATLPEAPLRIRVAGEAESLANPVPHLQVPKLVGNRGERPEFVVPSFVGGKSAMDDFSFEAAALVLTAHEGRPGHDLQFSSMLDRGTSLIRARYALNNSNMEGWGLYAEELVKPYLPLEAKLVATQIHLLRVARAFLDPELQLGKVKPEKVVSTLTGELGISKRLAELELRRYQFSDPGQATSYFYGLEGIERAYREVAAVKGRSFSHRCFNDGVLALGVLPVAMIGSELSKNLRCGSIAEKELPREKAKLRATSPEPAPSLAN